MKNKNVDSVSPSLMCKKLMDLCDTSLSRLSNDISSLNDDVYPLLLGYLDSISALISRTSMFCEQICKNPNFK